MPDDRAIRLRKAIEDSLDEMAVQLAGGIGPQFLELIKIYQRLVALQEFKVLLPQYGAADPAIDAGYDLMKSTFESMRSKLSEAERKIFEDEMKRIQVEKSVPQAVRNGFGQVFGAAPAAKKGCFFSFF